MNRLILIFTLFVFVQCNEPRQKESIPTQDAVSALDTIETETIDIVHSVVTEDTNITSDPEPVCQCPEYTYQRIHRRDALRFYNYRDTFDIKNLDAWKDSNYLDITSIEFTRFDTIPEEFALFKNVETVILSYIDWGSVVVPDIFPKLKHVSVWGKIVNLGNNPKWLKGIETFTAEKSQIVGIKSWKQLPNLRYFSIGHSGFDQFPSDFESLSCLQHFTIGAYHGSRIELSDLDVTNMPCLKYLKLLSWSKNLNGIPSGLENIKYANIHHAQLTEQEKVFLRDSTTKVR